MTRTNPTFKSTVHDDDKGEERMDKSAKNSDLGRDGLNIHDPMTLSRSSAGKSSQSLLSSPQPLPSANDNDGVTDSCNPETGARMDLDDTSSGRDGMVLHTSRASWNQPSVPAATPQSPKLLSPKDSGDDGHVRKKRKSSVGVVSLGRDNISTDHRSEDEEPDCDQTNGKSVATLSQTFSSKKSGALSKAPAVPQKSQKVPRQNLRGRLVGYARAGSQISVLPEKSDLSEDEEGGEVDQLLSDAIDGSGDLPAHRDTELASASVPDAVVDNVQESGPLAVTSALNSVDLTLEDDDDDVDDPSSLLSQARASSLATSSAISHQDKVFRPEIIRSETTGPDVSLKFNINHVEQVWANRPKKGQGKRRESGLEEVLVDAGVANTENDEKAVDALSRVIDKDDFATMGIVGQFNLGFIVVRRRKTVVSNDSDDSDEMDDLFIVDQHAADEKYNFETLQSTTVIQSQKLLRRQPLELTAADEMLAMENIEVLRQNGFEIEIDECAPIGLGSRLHLAAKPTSGSTVYDMKDLEEIIHLMRDRPSGQIVRCSKVRAMFAMRACRKSVMIGMPLNLHHMTTVIRHMGTIDQPWNCPHGRPTMRHLLDMRLSGPGRRLHEHPPPIDWSAF
ncbi:hypothetical protein BYT27DRAFT_6923499 [Phlegmacium glaucopus]|nr:hypothetical protein BYT27DRAFT_6923499 [Phlegmacium glaucopus]